MLGPDADVETLQKLVQEYSAKLSNNSLKKLENGFVHRFVTQRMYNVGKETAEASLNACMKALEAAGMIEEKECGTININIYAGYTIASRMREYAVYDTNVKLDAGWIDKINNGHNVTPNFDVLNIRSS